MATSVQVTSLCSVYNENPLSYLVPIGGFNFLIDCGWNDHFDPSFFQHLFRVASTVDAVLLSHSDTLHLGALPYAMKDLGLSAPIFSIEPVYQLGLLTMHNCGILLKLCISRRRRTGEDRGLGCTKLISLEDMLQACSLWEKFDVPVMLRSLIVESWSSRISPTAKKKTVTEATYHPPVETLTKKAVRYLIGKALKGRR